jgi:HxlR-like helix-turn-helix
VRAQPPDQPGIVEFEDHGIGDGEAGDTSAAHCDACGSVADDVLPLQFSHACIDRGQQDAEVVPAARLDDLERHAIVERRKYQSAPPRFEYVLTDKGRDLYPVIATLLAWGDKWAAGDDGPPALLVHDECGHVTTAKTVCAECGGELAASATTAVPGPGACVGPGTAVIGEFLAPARPGA